MDDECVHDAAIKGDLRSLRQLLDSEPALIKARTPEGDQSLHMACWGKRAEAVRLLLERGADPNARGDFGKTPLHYAVFEGSDESTEIVHLLLEAGADPSAKEDLLHQNPLGFAVHEQIDELTPSVELLRKAGAEVDLEAAVILGDVDRARSILASDDVGFPLERVRAILSLAELRQQIEAEPDIGRLAQWHAITEISHAIDDWIRLRIT